MRAAAPKIGVTWLVLGWASCLSPVGTAIASGAWQRAQAALVLSILWAATTGFVLLKVFPKGRIAPIIPEKYGESDSHAARVLIVILCTFAAVMVFALCLPRR